MLKHNGKIVAHLELRLAEDPCSYVGGRGGAARQLLDVLIVLIATTRSNLGLELVICLTTFVINNVVSCITT